MTPKSNMSNVSKRRRGKRRGANYRSNAQQQKKIIPALQLHDKELKREKRKRERRRERER